jgi:hypothetical protein
MGTKLGSVDFDGKGNKGDLGSGGQFKDVALAGDRIRKKCVRVITGL